MVVEKNQNCSIFLATYWNLSQNSGNLQFIFLKSGKFGPLFPWKILCIGQNHIFQVNIWQNFIKKKTLHLRRLLISWMNDNCAEVYGFVTGVSISNRAALKVRVPGSASTLCRPLIRTTEPFCVHSLPST